MLSAAFSTIPENLRAEVSAVLNLSSVDVASHEPSPSGTNGTSGTNRTSGSSPPPSAPPSIQPGRRRLQQTPTTARTLDPLDDSNCAGNSTYQVTLTLYFYTQVQVGYLLPYIEDIVMALPDFDPISPIRACSNLSWQVPDEAQGLIGDTSNPNIGGGVGRSGAIAIGVIVSVIVLVCICCCWYRCAFIASDDPAKKKNTAFVFAKPHANTPAVLEVIRTKFAEQGIKVLMEGVVTGKEIDSKGLIDQQYCAIAQKSTLTTGKDLPVTPEKFKEAFGEDCSTVVAEGRALDALELKTRFSAFQPEGALDKAWEATSASGKRMRLGDGFYCDQITIDGIKYYTFNAFFMTMRGKFTSPGSSIHYFVVEFDPATLSWADFRGKVLGPSTPADAPTDSLRGIVAANWQELGLQAPCDDMDNAVHASASPFESLAERSNWLACCVADDPFGGALLANGVPESTMKKWFNDPQVNYDDETAKEKGMSKGSIFGALKDLDYEQCLDRCVAIWNASAMTVKVDHFQVDKI